MPSLVIAGEFQQSRWITMEKKKKKMDNNGGKKFEVITHQESPSTCETRRNHDLIFNYPCPAYIVSLRSVIICIYILPTPIWSIYKTAKVTYTSTHLILGHLRTDFFMKIEYYRRNNTSFALSR